MNCEYRESKDYSCFRIGNWKVINNYSEDLLEIEFQYTKHMSEIGPVKPILQLQLQAYSTYNVKEECKSHVTKTMETCLRSIAKNYKGIT